MGVKLEINGETVEEFGKCLAKTMGMFLPLLKQTTQPGVVERKAEELKGGATMPPAQEVIDGEVMPPKDIPADPPKSEKMKTGRTKKDTPKEDENVPTIEDVRARLLTLGSKKGHGACFELLQGYGVKKASEVPADKFAEVIARIDDMLGGAE